MRSARFAEELTDDEMNDLIAEQAELQEKIDAIDGWDLERKAEIAMDAALDGGDVGVLSGGERRRVIMQIALSAPDMLLLDSRPTIWMLNQWRRNIFLHDFPGTVVTIPTIAIFWMR